MRKIMNIQKHNFIAVSITMLQVIGLVAVILLIGYLLRDTINHIHCQYFNPFDECKPFISKGFFGLIYALSVFLGLALGVTGILGFLFVICYIIFLAVCILYEINLKEITKTSTDKKNEKKS